MSPFKVPMNSDLNSAREYFPSANSNEHMYKYKRPETTCIVKYNINNMANNGPSKCYEIKARSILTWFSISWDSNSVITPVISLGKFEVLIMCSTKSLLEYLMPFNAWLIRYLDRLILRLSSCDESQYEHLKYIVPKVNSNLYLALSSKWLLIGSSNFCWNYCIFEYTNVEFSRVIYEENRCNEALSNNVL